MASPGGDRPRRRNDKAACNHGYQCHQWVERVKVAVSCEHVKRGSSHEKRAACGVTFGLGNETALAHSSRCRGQKRKVTRTTSGSTILVRCRKGRHETLYMGKAMKLPSHRSSRCHEQSERSQDNFRCYSFPAETNMLALATHYYSSGIAPFICGASAYML